MFEKVSKLIFVFVFILMLVIPLAATNFASGKISEDEKRALAEFPDVTTESGSFNIKFTQEFENWFDDNIGFRSTFISQDAKIQYYLFDSISDNKDMYLGPNGELNYATSEMITDYQHNNLYTNSDLSNIANSFMELKNYIENTGALFYYFQCWDKHTVYPEYFPKTVIQYGEQSKTDLFVKAICEQTDVKVISPKKELIELKGQYDTYSKYGDATHWTQRGAYIGYIKLMEALNAKNESEFRVLGEEDYNLTFKDQGSTLFGGIHFAEDIEEFEIKNPAAVLTNEKLTFLGEDKLHRYYTNDVVDNDVRLLILGDSYFADFLLDDLAESFHEVLIIWADYIMDIPQIMEVYKPDIVVLECAERCDRTRRVINLVNSGFGEG